MKKNADYLLKKKQSDQKIVALTCYDYPTSEVVRFTPNAGQPTEYCCGMLILVDYRSRATCR